ncbi:MAG: YCF48-related protein [Ignavibacteria bacterium]|nr:YCF48-related protein [Ignavibacteria bacterium]
MEKRIYFQFLILLFLSITSLQAQVFDWEWQNPKPTGADHNDAIILTPSKFLLLGNGGSVLISEDAGSTWTRQNIDTSYRDIYAVSFVDQQIGYVCGTGGLIMKTTNGGTDWQFLNSGVTVVLWDIEFIDANKGFAVGAAGNILSTINGGETWTSSTIGTTTIYKLHFVNDTLGYMGSASATTGRLFQTTDGGTTWVNISANITGLDGTVRGIYFTDINTGFISNSTGKIYKTTDGGATGVVVYNIGATTVSIYEVKFIDPLKGIAITSAGRIITTADGGTTWNLIQTDATKNLFGLGILTTPSKANASIIVGGDAGTIVKSFDGGITWELGYEAASQQQLQRASFPSENVGYVVGGSITTGNTFGDILKTTDAGETWTKLPFQTDTRIYSVFFINDNLGYIGSVGPTGVYKTTDGGLNWTSLNTGTGVASSIIYDIDFVDENKGFAIYSSGSVAKTTDGGTSWTPISSGWTGAAIYDMFIVNQNVMYLCGPGGRISRSIDGGSIFVQLTSLGTATLYSLHFFSTTSGYIAASGGRIFKTTDGLSFSEIPSPVLTTITLYAIRFVNETDGWFGASGGDVYYTEDGGISWTESNISLGTSQSTRDIQFAGNRMFVIGTDGMIIRGYSDVNIPVELTSFNADIVGTKVALNWTTASEVNNSGFSIERKTELNDFVPLSFIKGNGTVTGKSNYSFIDDSPVNGTSFYRLKQIDFDGSFEFSKEIQVDFSGDLTFNLGQNYPNPFNPTTNIKYTIPSTRNVSLKVFDILGNEVATLINEQQSAGSYNVVFDTRSLGDNGKSLSSGIYFYQLKSGELTSVKKLILIK